MRGRFGSGGGRGIRPRREQPGGVALGQGFDGLRFGEQAGLSGEQGVDAAAQPRPIVRRQVEMAAEVEQGDLADLPAGALRGDEAEGEIGFAGGFVPGCGFADEHAGRLAAAAGGVKTMTYDYGTTKEVPNHMHSISACYAVSLQFMIGFVLKMG